MLSVRVVLMGVIGTNCGPPACRSVAAGQADGCVSGARPVLRPVPRLSPAGARPEYASATEFSTGFRHGYYDSVADFGTPPAIVSTGRGLTAADGEGLERPLSRVNEPDWPNITCYLSGF